MIQLARSLTDDETAAFVASVEAGIADADAGRTIPYDGIRRWLLSWGTKDELSPPECK